MRVERLSISECYDRGSIAAQTLFAITHNAAALQKFINTNATGKAGRGIGWEAMTRSSDVIACGNRRPRSKEDGACVVYSRENRIIGTGLNVEMLRRKAIRQIDKAFHRGINDNGAEITKCGSYCVATIKGIDLSKHLCDDAVGERL